MKNLKLTNISLAVLVALGLVACGGSNDSTDHTTDKDKIELEKQKIEAEKKKLEEAKKKQEEEQKRLQEEKEKLEKEKKEDKGKQETPKPDDKNKPLPEKTATEVQRYKPTLEVPDDAKGAVASAKKFTVRRGFSNDTLGYDTDSDRAKYNKDKGTDPADILHTSTYNFSKEKDVVAVNGSVVTGDYDKASKGAINIGGTKDNLDSEELNAFVKGKASGKYYRVVPTQKGDKYTKDTPFKFATAVVAEAADGIVDGKIKQSDVIFLANAKKGDKTVDTNVIELKNVDKNHKGYDLSLGQVHVRDFTAFGKTYKSDALSQKIDLSNYKVDPNTIQVEEAFANYDIINSKQTSGTDDDKSISKKVAVGKFKIYNLPHSVAFVTTNPASDNEKVLFNIGDGKSSFHLNGMNTIALPKNGRARYQGKSFSASVEGNVELFADFSLNAAGIDGRIYDRVNHANDDEALPELTLERIELSSPKDHKTHADDGDVKGDESYANNWSVRLYGLDAQEAGGFLKNGTEIVEVYNTIREELTNKSNEVSNTD